MDAFGVLMVQIA